MWSVVWSTRLIYLICPKVVHGIYLRYPDPPEVSVSAFKAVTNYTFLHVLASFNLSELPEVGIDGVDPAVTGDNVILNCTATGDSPLVYQWTLEGSTTVLNSDNTTGTLELGDIQENQFGTYVCTVTNDLGMATSEVILQQAGILLTNSPC